MIDNKKKKKLKIQTTLQLILILSIVAIVALISASLYLSSAHKVSIASLGDIISAQASSSNTLILKLTEPLPSGTQIKGINFTGVPSGTSISVSLENQTPVYSDGYPEYSFSVSGLPEPLPYYNVTSLTYEVNGKTMVAPTITGEPMAIEEASWYSSNSNSFPKPTSIPSGIVVYIPITITNTQELSTQKPFQQMIKIQESQFSNYIAYNGNIANFEFFTQSGSVLPAWIESNTSGNLIIWVKIPGIPAKHSETIYLGFASQKTNLLSLSGTIGIGEAPQLSSNYEQYDDGASVFDIYFNGNTPTSDFVTGGGDTVTQQTGVTLPNGAIGNAIEFMQGYSEAITTVDMFTAKSIPNSPNYISEASFESDGDGTDANWGLVQNAGPATSYNGIFVGTQCLSYSMQDSYFNQGYLSNGYRTACLNDQGAVSTAFWRYSSLTYNSSSSYYGYIAPQLYSTAGGYSGTVSANPIAHASTLYWGFWGDLGGLPNDWTLFNWVRVRAYPPNGVMPSVSFGSLQTA